MIICITNQKGGIGKTTTAMALADRFQKDGKRTLIIDADPQGNASDTYGAAIEGEATLYDILMDRDFKDPLEAVQHTALGDIIASDPLLRKTDEVLSGEIDSMFRLTDAIGKLKEIYDVVIIDTAPAINMLLYNCLVAADRLIIPVSADRYSIVGLSQLYAAVSAIKKRANPSLVISGLLLTQYNDRTNLSRSAREALIEDAEAIGSRVFYSTIRSCVKCKEAQAQKKHLSDHAPACSTSKDYDDFYHEFIKEDK